MSNTEQSNQAVGQRTAAGFAQSNEPIPQSNHNLMPATASKGQIPTVDTAKIAPTTGPVLSAEQ
jgi:hypothetical protein